ncbi:polysaccharide deacetylase family protein [Congregibacter brevis]|uniref:Polysaccharide deacetylase family protein n=1 Tax=Congregibacter brevis TaxID=3081201 RepID=A0ABZ0IH58_9GAMM|nr:polysaccharide deacetylase family protein [Congregibacter sp. IMCC45268]
MPFKARYLVGAIALLLLVAVAPVVFVSLHAHNSGAIETDEEIVTLTFDDGPSPSSTLELLDLLDELKVPATFFITGSHAEDYPEIVAEAHSRGYQVANHGWNHKPLIHWGMKVPSEEVERTNLLIKRITGESSSLFRPPFLVGGLGLMRTLSARDIQIVGANASGLDWEEKDPTVIAQTVVSGVTPGSVILLHDGDGSTQESGRQASRQPTIEATKLLVNALRSQGYRFVPLSDLLD